MRQREQARQAALDARSQAAALALVPIDPNVAEAAREAEEKAEEFEKEAIAAIKHTFFGGFTTRAGRRASSAKSPEQGEIARATLD